LEVGVVQALLSSSAFQTILGLIVDKTIELITVNV
jgi:hypothetical protein